MFGGIGIGVYTWATKPAANAVSPGDCIWIKDIGPYRTHWISDGTSWRLACPQHLLFDTTAVVGVAQTAEQVVKQYTFKAGLPRALRGFKVESLWTKSGGTDPASTLQLRFGSAGTTADASIMSSTVMTMTAREARLSSSFFASAAAQIRKLAGQSVAAADFASAGMSTTSYPANTAVNDTDTGASILSLTATMGGTTDTPGIGHLLITGY